MNRDHLYLRHILDSIERIESYALVGKDEFFNKSHWHEATIRNFEVIGEASKHLSPEFKQRTAQVPWRNITGFRDVLIHDYMGVDLEAVWRVIEKDLPALKRAVVSALEPD